MPTKLRLKLAVLLPGLLCASLLQAAPKPPAEGTATWCSFDLPPMYIVTGPEAGKGSVQEHVRFLQSKLPQYEHKTQLSSIPRLIKDMREQQLVCAGMQRNEEREQSMLFSLPFYTTHPPALITLRSRLARIKPYLNAQGEVQLAELINNGELNLGLTAGRSYGATLDTELARHLNDPHVQVRTVAERLSEGLVSMMKLGRLDYTIAYESERRLFLEQLGSHSGDELVQLPIAGLPRRIPIYIVAPKTEWGQRFIQHINALLVRYWDDPQFRGPVLRIKDEAQRQRMLNDLRELRPGKRAQP
ncbi:TIGR02285 family protein [Pelomonas sp. V22]|uniref:TIGR02285 family protein n=1 Tax=Pelomonas sp. V22 TaxID=2822139 RepID=UPI0024A83306|nr:TIGR02285 family protein [Pelomonas sp. V22]MDI4635618.1 TIGR02285 family protein [Pelomonas sp. V22]